MIKPGTPHRGASEGRQVSRFNGFSSYCSDEVAFLVKDLSGASVEVSRADCEHGLMQPPTTNSAGEAPENRAEETGTDR